MGWNGPLTHRQFRAWMEYLSYSNLNEPSRSDYYLMQVAAEIRRITLMFGKSKKKIEVKDLLIKFKRKKKPGDTTHSSQEEVGGISVTGKTLEEKKKIATKLAQSRHFSMFGKPKVIHVPNPGTRELDS